jgi:hypothetical protein
MQKNALDTIPVRDRLEHMLDWAKKGIATEGVAPFHELVVLCVALKLLMPYFQASTPSQEEAEPPVRAA